LNADWERGYAAGYSAAHRSDVRDITTDRGDPAPAPEAKKPRKVSNYHKRYGREFTRLSPKYKNKRGGWKKNGYRSTVRAAHAATKKAMR
jgi:hypothetical protein